MTIKRQRLAALIGAIAIATAFVDSTQAAVFSNPVSDSAPQNFNPFTIGQIVDPNITVTGLGRGTGIGPNAASNRYNANNWSTSGFDTNDYFTWTLTPNSGFEIDFTALAGAWQRSSTGPNTYALRTSLDSFGNDLAAGSITGSGSASSYNIDLSALQNITSSIEFRLYGWGGSAATGTFSINDFLFDGFVNPVTIGGGFPYWDADGVGPGIGGAGTWDTSSSSWNSAADGSGTHSTYSSVTPATFGGAGGIVNIAAGGVTAEGGVHFDVSGYTITDNTLTLGSTNSTVSVTNAADTATISSQISGTNGITKSGAGTLVLSSSVSNFVGAVRINAGTLSISDDLNLGDVNNPISLGGGTLHTENDLSLGFTRSLNGNGTIAVTAGKTMTVNGTVGDTTPVALDLAGSGTVVLANGSLNSASVLSFSNDGTLSVTGVDLNLPGNITSTNTTGTATVTGNVNFGAGTRTVSVADGSAATDLHLGGNLSGASVLVKTGAGTLSLTGDNSGLTGTGTIPATIRQGTAGNTPVNGGVIEFDNANALGTGQLQLNGGTLKNTSVSPVVLTNFDGISTGAQDHVTTPGGLILAGSDIELSGGISLFKPTSATLQNQITVNNTTTVNGSFGAATGSGTSTGITIAGTGKLVLNNPTNVIDANVPVTVQDATLELNGGLTTSALNVAPTGKVVANAIRLDALNIDGTATIRPNGGIDGASKMESLTINAGGKLNLKDNDLVVGTAVNVDAVRDAIVLGKTNNAAAGITSDLPAFGVSTGFGYALGGDLNISPSLGGFLAGQSYDTDSVLVKYTYLGDADLDGDSDLNDLGLWASAFTGDLGNPAIPSTFWTSGDFDYDGDTDLNDLGLWSSTFTGDLGGGAGSLIVVAPGASEGAISALNGMGITVVPEPSTFVLAGVGLVGLAISARRRRMI